MSSRSSHAVKGRDGRSEGVKGRDLTSPRFAAIRWLGEEVA